MGTGEGTKERENRRGEVREAGRKTETEEVGKKETG